MILCGLKIKENWRVLVNQFHGHFRSKTYCCKKIKCVFRDVISCFNASWGLKGLKTNGQWYKMQHFHTSTTIEKGARRCGRTLDCFAMHASRVGTPLFLCLDFKRNILVYPFSMWLDAHANGGLVGLRLKQMYRRKFRAEPRATRSFTRTLIIDSLAGFCL